MLFRSVAWSKEVTGSAGVDGIIDCLPPGAPASAMTRPLFALRRGGNMVNVGAVTENLTLNAFWMMTNRIGLKGSVWFTSGEGEEMVAMADAGMLDLSIFDHRVTPLSNINEGLAAMNDNKDGGFANYIINSAQA